jgi:hypothetical protein
LPTLDCAVQYRILDGPKDYGPLADFSCGKRGRQWEREVNRDVAGLFGGAEPMQQIVVVLEKAVGEDHYGRPLLIGVCGLASLQAEGIPGLPDKSRIGYVGAIGTDAMYREHVLEDGVTRCGSALLMSAMVVMRTMFGGEMPAVLAKVLPNNRGSMRLFTGHGFDNLGAQEGSNMMLRPPDLAPDFRR